MNDPVNPSVATRAGAALEALPARGVRSAVVQVEDAAGGVLLSRAVGSARVTGEPMTVAHRFHVASITKTMTATVILQLWEEGAFARAGLDTRFGDLGVLEPEFVARLHRRDGVSAGADITLRHLLTHTSGLRDAMVDDADTLGGPAPRSLVGRMLAGGSDPGRHWAPWNPSRPDDAEAGVVNFFVNSGIAAAALSAPGEAFHYSDTGFMLLGLAIEALGGEPLHLAYQRRIFAPLGLTDTYLAYRNDPAGLGPAREPESDCWAGEAPCLAGGVSLSFDWAGGGVVSTVRSLNAFLRALLRGELLRRRATVSAMTDWCVPPGLEPPRTGVGLGIFRTERDGLTLIGHSGSWGAKMFHSPAAGFFLAGTINQAAGPDDWHWAIAREFT